MRASRWRTVLPAPAIASVVIALLLSGTSPAQARAPRSKANRPVPVTVTSPTTLSGEPTAHSDKRLIEFGWDTPSVNYLHDHLGEMQSLPFDGVTFRLNADKTPRLRAFEPGQWTEERLQLPLLADLPSRYGRLDHSFIQLNGPSQLGLTDWFDDSLWGKIDANLRLFSKAVSISGAEGVLFDPEFYGMPGTNPWEFRQPQYPGKSFWEVAEKVRERGRQFISALQSQAPGLTFLSLFFPSYQYQQSPVSILSSPEKAPDPLMFFFNQGIVEGAAPGVQLVDGHEWSYYNGSTSSFIRDHLEMRKTSEWFPTETHDNWEGVQLGPGIFMDFAMGMYPAGAPQTPLSQAERLMWLQHNVYWALQSSDQYAWFYSERQDWYRDPGNPAGVYQAVARARELVASGAPLGYDMSITGEGESQRAEIWEGSLPLRLKEPSSRTPRRSRRRARRSAMPRGAFSLRTSASELSSASLIVDGVPVASDHRAPFWFALKELSPGSHTAIMRAVLPGGGTISSAPRTYTRG